MGNKSFILALIILLYGCNLMNNNKSPSWSGVYRGVLPCTDCEGIQTEIRLYPDNTFEMRRKYMGKGDSIQINKGNFKWNQPENRINLQIIDKEVVPSNYRIGENQLTQLDANGNPIQSSFPEKYVLKKAATIR